jgi:fibronectin-binding autotransporter adhesin
MDSVQQRSQPHRLRLALVAVFSVACARAAMAADYAAATNGTWSNPAIWTPSGGPPGADDYAFIGAINSEMGAAAYASVALSSSQSVYNLTLGYGTATGGTLNLAGFPLTVSSTIYLGQPGVGIGVIEHNGGYFTTEYLDIYNGNSLVLAASDSIADNISLFGGSQLTTATSTNFYSAPVSLFTGSTLTLGASLSMASILDLEQSSTLNMAGFPMSVYTVDIGSNDLQAVSVTNRGAITTPHLNVAANTFNLIPADVVTNLSLTNTGQMTTAAIGNVTSQATVDTGSTLTLGASMSLPGTFDLERSSTLNMAGHGLYASAVDLGSIDIQPVSVVNSGPITTPYLNVGATAFNLIPSDAVQNLTLSNTASTLLPSGVSVTSLSLNISSSATTSASNNVISAVTVASSSLLTLASSMSINGTFDLEQGGTLNMAGHGLSATVVEIGSNYLQPVSVINRGPITAPYLDVAAQPFNLIAADSVASLSLASTAQVTTAAIGNVTSSVTVATSSTLTLGSSMSINGTLDVETSSTLNMAGHGLSATVVEFGANYLQPVTVSGRGPITAPYLYVASEAFNLIPSDAVANFYLNNFASTALASSESVSSLNLSNSSQGTTSATGNITTGVSLASSSTLTLGASMSLGGVLDLEQSSTLNMANHPLSALVVEIGTSNYQPVTILNRAAITATYLDVAAQAFNLLPADNVANLSLAYSGQMATSATSNVASAATISASSILTLGASMSLSGALDLERSSTLNMAFHAVAAGTVDLGALDLQPVTVLNRGPFITPYLNVASMTFNLSGSDAVTNFSLNNLATTALSSSVSVASLSLSNSSQATTSATSNVTTSVTVSTSSTLTLGASMSLSGALDVENSATLDMAGHSLHAATVYFGWLDSQPAFVRNPGPVTANYLYAGGGSSVTLSAPNSVVNTQIELSDNSALTLQQPGGQLTGLTFQGSSSGNLIINDTSVLELSGSNNGQSWLFRWQDPVGGSWVNTLTGSIASGHIAVSSSAGYSVFDLEGYTYVATPSTLIWNGGGADNNWGTAGNWSGVTPTAGHWLRFGPLAAGGHTANSNNLAINTLFYGIFFDTAAPSYSLQGNAIELSGDVVNQSANNQTIGLNIQLVPGDGAFDVGTFDTGGLKITDSGSVSGAGMALTKAGSGTLVLSGTNTYSGGTYVTDGKLMVTTSYGLPSDSNLYVGENVATDFAAVTPDQSAPAAAAAGLSPVPEPGTLALLAAALGGAAIYRRARSPRMHVSFIARIAR